MKPRTNYLLLSLVLWGTILISLLWSCVSALLLLFIIVNIMGIYENIIHHIIFREINFTGCVVLGSSVYLYYIITEFWVKTVNKLWQYYRMHSK